MAKDTIRKSRWNFSTPDAIFDVQGLDIYEQMIYILLCSHANRDGKSFPSYDTLAERGRMSRRKAINSVKKLVEMGLILKKEQYRDNGGDTANEYTIVDAYDFLEEQEKQNADPERGAPHAPGGVHHMHPGGAQHAPKHNHITIPKETMIDCMDASAEIAAAAELDPIYESLIEHIPNYCYVAGAPLSEGYINEIYLMLMNQFKRQLDPAVIKIACELYFDRACSVQPPDGVKMKLNIENPVGFFRRCYEDAIKQYKATRNRRKRA